MSDASGEGLELSQAHKAAIVIASLTIALILTVGADLGIGAFVVYFLSSLLIVTIVGTKDGRMAAKEAMEEMQKEMGNQSTQQQQQIGGQKGSKPTQICSECGWKNPKSNNYCHDCGSKLDG